MKKFFCKLLFVSLLFIINGCNLDNLDFNKLSDEVDIPGEYVLPIANADISVWDIVESVNEEGDTLLEKGDNDVIKIVYKEESIYDYEVRELLNLPTEESFSTGEKEIGNIKLKDVTEERGISIRELQDRLSGPIDNVSEGNQVLPQISYPNINEIFEVDPVDEFKTVTIESGTLNLTVNNSGLQSSRITIGGQFYDRNYPNTVLADFLIEDVSPGTPESKLFNLSNLTISNEINFKLTKVEITPSYVPEQIDLDADLFKVDLAFSDLEIRSGRVKVKEQVLEDFNGSFDFLFEDDDINVYEAAFAYGTLEVSLSNGTPFTGSLKLVFPNVEGEELNPIDFGTSGSGTMTLAGSTINLAKDETSPYNTFLYEYSVTIDATTDYVDFDSNQSLSLDIQLDNLEFQSIQGNFGERSVTIDEGSFNMDTEFFDKIEGDFRLADPTLNLILTNSIGIPAVVDAHFTAQNNLGTTATIDTTDLVINSRASISSPAIQQTITFDKDNSNIVDFIALPPSGDINYGGNIRFNPDGDISQTDANFFNLDDSLRIDVGLDLPFELQLENLALQDTAEIDGDDFDMIESAELIINAINQIPLDINIQLFFVDTISGQHFGSPIESGLLVSGSSAEPSTSKNTITLKQEDVNNLQKSNAIVFKGIVSSPQNGTRTAVIYSESRLNINVAIRSKIVLTD